MLRDSAQALFGSCNSTPMANKMTSTAGSKQRARANTDADALTVRCWFDCHGFLVRNTSAVRTGRRRCQAMFVRDVVKAAEVHEHLRGGADFRTT